MHCQYQTHRDETKAKRIIENSQKCCGLLRSDEHDTCTCGGAQYITVTLASFFWVGGLAHVRGPGRCAVLGCQGGGNAVPVRFRPSAGETRRASLALAYVGVDDGRRRCHALGDQPKRMPSEGAVVPGLHGKVCLPAPARGQARTYWCRAAPPPAAAVQTTTRSAAAAAGSMDRSYRRPRRLRLSLSVHLFPIVNPPRARGPGLGE